MGWGGRGECALLRSKVSQGSGEVYGPDTNQRPLLPRPQWPALPPRIRTPRDGRTPELVPSQPAARQAPQRRRSAADFISRLCAESDAAERPYPPNTSIEVGATRKKARGIAATRTRAPRNGQQVRRPRRTWRSAPGSKYARWKEGTESYPNFARRCFRRRGVAEPRRRLGAAPGGVRPPAPPRTPSHGPAGSPTARPARPRVCTALVPRLLSRSRPPARPPSPLARREPAPPLSTRRE